MESLARDFEKFREEVLEDKHSLSMKEYTFMLDLYKTQALCEIADCLVDMEVRFHWKT